MLYLGQLGHTFLLFFGGGGRGTGPKRSGAVLACSWANFQAKPSFLEPIRVIFDDLGPNRHFGRVFDLQDHPRDWPGTSQVLPTPGGRDSGRLGLSVRTWLAEAATAADLRKKFELFCDCPKSARLLRERLAGLAGQRLRVQVPWIGHVQFVCHGVPCASIIIIGSMPIKETRIRNWQFLMSSVAQIRVSNETLI